jgi:hypothetical protein
VTDTRGSSDRHRHLKELIGKTVSFATFTQDSAGYDMVWLEFEDGSELEVIEHSQTGEIRVKVS